MVEYDLIDNVKICQWNTQHPRLEEIFETIFVKPPPAPTKIHIYEPLADSSATILQTMSFTEGFRHIFILFSAEGHGEQEYDRLLAKFKNEFAKYVDHDDIILYTAAFSLSSDEYRHVQNWSGILNNTLHLSGGEMKFTPATKFCTFLNREHRWQRQYLFEELHRRDVLDKMHVSYLNPPPGTKYGKLYPRILDKTQVNFEEGYNLEVGLDATFSLVAESSYENLGNLKSIEVPGITEKTYKTILSCQIPIFLSTAYTVYHFRIMGFDVFDGIVDHSYDLIQDPEKRILAVADEVERLSKNWDTLLDQKLRSSLSNRFKYNLELMKWYGHPRMEYLSWYRQFANMKLT